MVASVLRCLRLMGALLLVIALPGHANTLTIEEIASSKGIKAWLVTERSVPVVAIRYAFLGGALQDPMHKEGLARFLAATLPEGAGDLPAAAFKQRYLSLGSRLSATSSKEAVSGVLLSLRDQLSRSVGLFHLMVTSPRFDSDAIERKRAELLADLATEAHAPAKLALNRWYAEAFAGHSYARPQQGTPDSIAAITTDDVKAQHGRLFAKDVLRVVIVGDIDRSAAAEVLDRAFGDLPDAAQIIPIDKIAPRSISAPVVVDMDQPTSSAVFGVPSLSVDDPDFPALQILNYIVGSGDFDSRLMDEIRIKRGLAYAINTRLISDSLAPLVLGEMTTKNENMGIALDLVREVFASIARDGPEEAQFETAKRYLTGSFLLDFDSSARMADSLLTLWLRNKTPDYLTTRNRMIEAVRLDDVRRVAGNLFARERFIVAVVGKPKLGQ
jgi:zinc protease